MLSAFRRKTTRELQEASERMAIHLVRLIGREAVADNTMAFRFEKPDGFLYKAGQFAEMTLIDYSTGPAGLVAAMRKLLNDAGVDDDTIRTEEFTGD